MKTYFEIAPQIPIEHKIWVSDGSLTGTEQHTVSMLCNRVWQHDEDGFRQTKNRTDELIELKQVPEREQIRLMLSARTLDSAAVQWISDNCFIRVTDPKFFIQTP